MSAAITRHEPSHLATVETFRFTADQRKLILDTCCGGASPSEAQVLLGIAEMRGLNPLAGECYFVKRWDNEKRQYVWAVQVSIDGMRIKAEETGLYAGQDEPEFEYEADGKTIKLARVRIYRSDWQRPMVGVARYSEYVQKTREGAPTRFWREMGHNQLAKCAEANGLRKAFPSRFAKLYTPEEMQQAEREGEERGEVVEQQAPPKRQSEPPPALTCPPSGDANMLRARIVGAATQDALKAVWADVLKAAKGARITLEERASLADCKDAQKAKLTAPIDTAAAIEEAMGDNPMPEGWGGEVVAPDEPCCFCGESIKPGAKHKVVESGDGEVRFAHAECTAFGKGTVES